MVRLLFPVLRVQKYTIYPHDVYLQTNIYKYLTLLTFPTTDYCRTFALKMKTSLLTLLLSISVLAATAQTDSTATTHKKQRHVELFGEVYDSFTKTPVKAHLTLMTAGDSAVVDTTSSWTWGTQSFFQFNVPVRQADYIIKGTCEGYEDGYLNYELRHIARNNHFELPRLLLKKRQDVYKEVGLDGVVVTGTRVKIAYRGDTIVYNASAFNLPEGSMLDGLIRQMPGAELKDNGDIYINGRKVDYLMLNGKDFFKGQNKVMLDNLPYYTVRELKVYDKSTKRSELIGHEVEKKDYVMDVQLKREYNRGIMGNAEAGAGTDDRYMARLFSLYYDDHTRLSIFGNVNNVNEDRRPGSEGEWKPANMPQGLRTTKMTGMHLSTEDQDKRWEDNFDASLTWDDARNESRTARETFAADGSIFGASSAFSRQKDFRFSANNVFTARKIGLNASIGISYVDGRRDAESADSTMRDVLINQMLNQSHNRYRAVNLSSNIFWNKKFEWGDYITLVASGGLNRQKPSEQFALRDTRYTVDDATDHRHYYSDTHQQGYEYSLQAGYTYQLPNQWYLAASVGYEQKLREQENGNYRLDWLAQKDLPYKSELDFLPSSRDALLQCYDPGNSDSNELLMRTISPELQMAHTSDNSYFAIDVPLHFIHERLHFDDNDIDTLARRRLTSFNPSVFYSHWGRNYRYAGYSVNVAHPDFVSLMPGDDSTNPLAYRENNPDLKATITQQFMTSVTWTVDSLKRTISLNTNASIIQRSVGTRTTYDPATGAYSYRPDNINGNWTASLSGSYRQPIDRKKRLTLTEEASAAYIHSVDFPVLYVAVSQQPSSSPRSTVHNWTLSDYLGLEYQRDKLTVSLSGNVAYRRSTSSREDFQRISAIDYDYGLALTYTIPVVNVTLATDLRMFSRRGYRSSLMNDDHLVWNAQLTRSLFKGALTAKLQAFDLLHQLSSTQYAVNAQGRTETWHRCIPRYVMFTIALKKMKKAKE